MRRRTGEDAAVDRRTCVHQEVQRVDDLHGGEESGSQGVAEEGGGTEGEG